jgi:hypothetical protein
MRYSEACSLLLAKTDWILAVVLWPIMAPAVDTIENGIRLNYDADATARGILKPFLASSRGSGGVEALNTP